MKMILAFVQPFKLEAVTRNLENMRHFPGMTVGSVRGFGREHSDLSPEANDEMVEDFSDKVQIQTVVHDDQVNFVVDAIAEAAHTGRYGDGMIFVVPVERTIRIATRHEGDRVV